MKIERINENQIRCTLTQSDLADRQIELSELAYGSEKARDLFHELIQSAAAEVGFEVENMPLMVEAIPMSRDSIVLIVTRVADPDELDTRFSRFSPSKEEEEWENVENSSPTARLFAFSSLDEATAAAAAVNGLILVHSTLYKHPLSGQYILCIHCGDEEDAFRRTCNTLSEYGALKHSPVGALAYCEEHCEIIIANRALDKLARMA